MRAVFDHSWGLLSTEERGVLGRLSVFRGGFRREAGEVVAGASLPLLSALVDRSWVRRSPSGRYEMHELIRQYCADKLDAEPVQEGERESERVRDGHSRYYGAFLHGREERLRGRGQAEAFNEILEDVDNVWAAWGWAVERGDVETIGRCVEMLVYAGRVRRWYHEMTQAFDHAAPVLRQHLHLDRAGLRHARREQTALVLADMLSKQALLCGWHGMSSRAAELSEESLALVEDVEPGVRRDSVTIYAKVVLGSFFAGRGDPVKGKQLCQEALALAEEVGAPWDREYALFHLGMHASHEGRYPEAEGFLQRAIAIADDIGERVWKAHSLNRLSWVCWAEGRYGRGQMVAEESLRIFEELGDPAGIAFGMLRLGEIATALGKYDLASQHFQKSHAAADEISAPILLGEILNGQGTFALALAQPAAAKGRFEESLAVAREAEHVGLLTEALTGLGYAYLGLGEPQQARECFCQALEGAMETEWTYLAVSAVMGMATLLAVEGDLHRAGELVALVLQHPSSTQADRNRAQDLLSELPPQMIAATVARGRARELEEVAPEILGRHADAANGRREQAREGP